ncbi:MAG: hypothetical protein DWQ42_02165 [Planctomycetota bacterium]|nr:MAG: hypothetical protein DWQ42_02165 [Planctomycetota bacterium]REK49258.1 MAG: hypothetical protein DWQ46_00600 [Planctomycetota bacterium]
MIEMLRGKCSSVPLIAVLLGMALVACQREEIEHYTVDKTDAPYRLLAAMIPEATQTWFVRVEGPRELIDRRKVEFDYFVNSIRLTGDVENPLEWKKPGNWVESKNLKVEDVSRYAAFRLNSQPDAPEVVITPLRGSGGAVLPNLNRYRVRMGLGQIQEAQLPRHIEKRKVNGVEVTLFDVRGNRSDAKTAAPLRTVGRGSRPGLPELVMKVVHGPLPEGWHKVGESRDGRQYFQAGDDVRLTIRPVQIDAVAAYELLNGWRFDLGLKKLELGATGNGVEMRVVAGRDVWYANFQSPAAKARGRRAIVGTVIPIRQWAWTISMRGPADAVERERARFDQFISTVDFETLVDDENGKSDD